MVTMEKIKQVEIELNRFKKALVMAKKRIKKDGFYAECGCIETGAVRRASMDLTRVLTILRK